VESGRPWIAALASSALLFACNASKAPAPVEAGVDFATGCQDVDGPIPGMPVATFDTDVERFVLDTATVTNTADSGTPFTSLADPSSGTNPPPTLSHDAADGNPSPGSLEIFAPFSGANQFLLAYRFDGCGTIHDWTGKTLHARIKIASGDYTGDALVYVATSTTCTTFDFGYATYAPLAHTSCWQELSLDLANPYIRSAGYDPASVVTVGINFTTYAPATPVTFLVDSFSVE
jgi:hypothetical protein